ncbi:UNVERIFIED_CONTAM: hypothetical protein GTU68_037934 [Idotea baltica]|nr:hypothetical protein [Idotea baltica]
MENPCLTFVTPTLLAGDRSLSDVIAHEICHSWTGNLVTSCSWEHFWLNEGFTVFLERKVKAKMAGTPAQHMSAIEGWNSLQYCIEHRGSTDPLTALIPDLEGIDPDDAFCSVPYEKGHTFLWYLQSLVGGPDEFDPFLMRYLDRFHGRAIDSECFKSFFCSYFVSKAEALKDVDWHAWFHAPGMPPYTPKFDTSLVDSCYKLSDSWKEWSGEGEPPFSKSDLEPFSSNQIIVWLEKMFATRLSLAKVQKMEETYALGEVTNAEIRFRWLRLCLQVKWDDKVEEALAFVNAQGRLKFVRPIYRDLYLWEEARSRAVSNFLSQKSAMMHVSVLGISKDLHLEEESS